MESESELIARCQAGDTAAWEALFQQHYAAVGRFIFQLASDFSREDVEEICQESFLAAIRHLRTFQGNCRLQTWLFRLAANKASDYRHKQQAAKRGGGVLPVSLDHAISEDGPTLELPSPQPTPDESLQRQEQSAQVVAALGHLGPPCQEMIELKYFGDLSYEEIAAALRINPKTVSSRLSRCLDHLEQAWHQVAKREVKT